MKLNRLFSEGDFEGRNIERKGVLGDVDDKARHLVTMLRSGEVSMEEVELAADLGHPVAAALVEDSLSLEPRNLYFRAFLSKWYPRIEEQLDGVYRGFYQEWNRQFGGDVAFSAHADLYMAENEEIIETRDSSEKADILWRWVEQYNGEVNEDFYRDMFEQQLALLMPEL